MVFCRRRRGCLSSLISRRIFMSAYWRDEAAMTMMICNYTSVTSSEKEQFPFVLLTKIQIPT